MIGRASALGIRQALHLAIDELGPRQLTLYALGWRHCQAARQAFDAAVRQRLELAQAWCQAIGVYTHRVQPAQAATRLWPLCGDLLAQRVIGVEQPRGFAEADTAHVVVLVLVAAGAEH